MKTNLAVSTASFAMSLLLLAAPGTVLLIASGASAQNLFETDASSDFNVYEFMPNGGSTTFASGLDRPCGLAFNSAGDLFEADSLGGHIYEFTPNGGSTTFASGVSYPVGLAFNSAGDLFEADQFSGNIYEFMPNGGSTTFASGLAGPEVLAFQGVTLPVPEPSALGLVAVGLIGLLRLMRRRNKV
jgi:hypothetical protein